ncbi:hypothetical protein GGQ74_000570 [Desulfobaculum xiamenense]|uniref:C4-type zinc ribbon domain-containing protein n=1 Tax=Desulfobaculum xiamenense TaxID=995050 RepID=A0A846QIM0_9BACT|nr:C4-type zinc ribbon domain-containing protein [Desulfobaculum xiamenense]NJB66930.1 hypothetical protein [Desulfobaculum xiamenense]
MYLKQIEQLVVLQKVDDEIIVIEKELESLPKELAALEEKNAKLTERMEQTKERTDILLHQQRLLADEIDSNDSKIKKSKNKLMMAGNTREYQAMMREMDNMEKINRSREEEKIALMDEMNRQKERQTAAEAEAEELKGQLEECSANLKKRTATAKKRLTKLQKDRETACEVIPPRVLGRYEFIRARIQHPVIVPVDEAVCNGCHILIPPQIFNELQRGEQILSCPNCQRLIYWTNHFCAPADAPAAPAAEVEAEEQE